MHFPHGDVTQQTAKLLLCWSHTSATPTLKKADIKSKTVFVSQVCRPDPVEFADTEHMKHSFLKHEIKHICPCFTGIVATKQQQCLSVRVILLYTDKQSIAGGRVVLSLCLCLCFPYLRARMEGCNPTC